MVRKLKRPQTLIGIGGLIVSLSYFLAEVFSGGIPMIWPFSFGLWASLGGITVGAILILRGLLKDETSSAVIESKSDNNKVRAKNIHDNLIKLETDLWLVRDNIPKDSDPLNNAEVKKVFSDIQVETNNLATLVNDRGFDEFIEALLSIYTRYLMFNMNPYEHSTSKLINRAHRKIRWYINNKVKG